MSKAPKVSIITPTRDRAQLLNASRWCVEGQLFSDWEWLILDDGAEPHQDLKREQQGRIRYEYSRETLSIGAKRNKLISKARGDVIVQFDDDDYYSPYYITKMLNAMHKDDLDFVKLYSMHVYSVDLDLHAYWDLNIRRTPQFMIQGGVIKIVGVESMTSDEWRQMPYGYGCTYVFKKKVWDLSPFPDRNWGEDSEFYSASSGSVKFSGLNDEGINFVKMQHARNTSRIFPQGIIPEFMIRKAAPAFFSYRRLAIGR